MKFSIGLFALAFICFSRYAEAYPNMPGACLEGGASVGGPHLTAASLTESSLEDEVAVVIGGILMADARGRTSLAIGQDHQWSLTSATRPIEGLLFRVGNKDGFDTTGVLSTDQNNLGPAAICVAPATGIGHVAELEAMVAVGTIRVDEGTDLDVDITVVFENKGNVSDFAYQAYKLTFEADGSEPPDAATDMPDGPGGVGASPAPSASAAPTASEAPSESTAPAPEAPSESAGPPAPSPMSSPSAPQSSAAVMITRFFVSVLCLLVSALALIL